MAAWHICQVRLSIDTHITSAMAESLDAIDAVYTKHLTAADKIEQITQALDKQTAVMKSGVLPGNYGNCQIRKYFDGL